MGRKDDSQTAQNTLKAIKNFNNNEPANKELLGFIMLKERYMVFGVIDFSMYFSNAKTAFEIIFYFNSVLDEHYRLRFEPAGSYN